MNSQFTDIIERELSDASYLLHYSEQTETILFEYVLEQYEAIVGETMAGKSVVDQCKIIWTWYYNKYNSNKLPKKQGISRSVSRVTTEDAYYFDIPYQEKQFCSNMLGQNRIESEFIKHICVAFKMDPDSCNDCLTAYGYFPLHSKNLHDLAIYSVLTTIEIISDDNNPLLLVKERYFKALDIIKRTSNTLPSDNSIETKLLTNEIESVKQFDEKHFFSYLKKNASYLNWRHSAILQEHKRLLKVFQYLYDDYQKGASWSSEESKYSLFSFVNQFCKEISHKDFGERLINDIQRDDQKKGRGNRHPTREIMILLWLYEECFRNSQPILSPLKYTKLMETNFWKKSDIVDEEGRARTTFHIHKYLFGDTIAPLKAGINIDRYQFTGTYIFVGAVAKQIINEKLQKYGYSVLSSQNSIFDRVILQLLTLRVYHLSHRKDSILCDSRQVSLYGFDFGGSEPMDLGKEFKYILDNYLNEQIPISLALIFEILSAANKLQEFHTTSSQEEKFLLSCNLNSQI